MAVPSGFPLGAPSASNSLPQSLFDVHASRFSNLQYISFLPPEQVQAAIELGALRESEGKSFAATTTSRAPATSSSAIAPYQPNDETLQTLEMLLASDCAEAARDMVVPMVPCPARDRAVVTLIEFYLQFHDRENLQNARDALSFISDPQIFQEQEKIVNQKFDKEEPLLKPQETNSPETLPSPFPTSLEQLSLGVDHSKELFRSTLESNIAKLSPLARTAMLDDYSYQVKEVEKVFQNYVASLRASIDRLRLPAGQTSHSTSASSSSASFSGAAAASSSTSPTASPYQMHESFRSARENEEPGLYATRPIPQGEVIGLINGSVAPPASASTSPTASASRAPEALSELVNLGLPNVALQPVPASRLNEGEAIELIGFHIGIGEFNAAIALLENFDNVKIFLQQQLRIQAAMQNTAVASASEAPESESTQEPPGLDGDE